MGDVLDDHGYIYLDGDDFLSKVTVDVVRRGERVVASWWRRGLWCPASHDARDCRRATGA
jgi:hypothetical protein